MDNLFVGSVGKISMLHDVIHNDYKYCIFVLLDRVQTNVRNVG